MSLKEKQALPLKTKLAMTQFRIMEWYRYWDGKVFISNSGGRDSSVLAHIVMGMYPDVPNVFLNTGLEFPEIVKHVETFPNLVKLQPVKPFMKVIRENGYPILSKEKARGLRDLMNPSSKNYNSRKLRATGIKQNGVMTRNTFSKKYKELFNIHETENGWIARVPFKVSEECCNYMKKKPSHQYSKKCKSYPVCGTMASEGGVRLKKMVNTQCNTLGENPISNPLSFWIHTDILEYVKQSNIKVAEVYSMGYERTGCVFCMFGVHLDHRNIKGGLNRFQLLKQTHPKLWTYCMDKLDLRTVMAYLKLPIE